MSPISIREALKRASSFMQSLEDGRHLAEIIIRHVLEMDRTHFFLCLDEKMTEEQWMKVESFIKQRLDGIPLQYLIGEQEFYGLPFKVNASVLIPRPETEILVEQVLCRRDKEKSFTVADIGTGSGAIAVSLAAHSKWSIIAVDIAQASLDKARENSQLNGVESQISFRQGDLLEPLLGPVTSKVDILVSNPPYIPSRDIAELDVQVREHEPLRALDGGADGLDFYRKICAGLKDVLLPQGLVAFEVGMGQSQDVEKLLLDSGVIQSTIVIPDLAGIERIVMGEGK